MIALLGCSRRSMALALSVRLVGMLVGALLISAQARAQSILVSAERLTREETITRVHLDDTTPATTQDWSRLTERVANLGVAASGAGSFGSLFTYRGLSNTPYFSDPALSVYFDDLPLTSSFTYPTALFGFCDAVIARGPEASAFGRTGQGGVIAFRSPEASPSAGAELRSSIGAYALHSLALAAHTPAAGPLDLNLTAAHATRDGYIHNTLLDQPVDDQDTSALSARLRWRASAAAQFSLQLLANRQRSGAQPLIPLDGPHFSVTRDREGETNIDFLGVALKGLFDTPVGHLLSITSHTDWQLDPYTSRLVLPPAIDSHLQQGQRAWNEELRLISKDQGSIRWSIGAWFSDSETRGTTDRSIPDLVPIEASNFELNSRTRAIFGEATLLTEHWTFTGGLRLEHTARDFERLDRMPYVIPATFGSERTFAAVLPRLSARYAFSDTTHLSATLSRGTKPGGWSAYTANPALAPFDAEIATALEVTLDTQGRDGALTLAARTFAYAIHDYQIERSFNADDYLVVNAPRARSLGAELEANWVLNSQLNVAAALGSTWITLREFIDPFTGASYAGNRAPYAPRYTAHLGVTWHTAHWFAAGDLTAVGATFFDEAENPTFEQRGYQTLGARAGYDNARWRFTLFGDNLTDARYDTLIVPGVAHAVPGAPRTWGMEFALRLGASTVQEAQQWAR